MSKQNVVSSYEQWKHWLGKCWLFLGVCIILLAIIFSIFRALTPWARQYKPQVEQRLSVMFGQPVTIQTMATSWYWLEPVLQLNQVSLTDAKHNTLKLKKLLIGIDLWSSLWHRQLQPGILYVEHARLIVRQQDNHWLVDGLNLNGEDVAVGPESYLPVLLWLSAQEKIIIRHVSVLVRLKDGSALPWMNWNFTIQNHGDWYRVKGKVQLVQDKPTEIAVSTDLYVDPRALHKTKGRVYLSVKSVVLKQWKKFLPTLPVTVNGGEGEATLWLDFKQGSLLEGQSLFHFNPLILVRQGYRKPQTIDEVQANIGWKRTKRGWDLSGDKIQLHMNGVKWPENAFHVYYKSEHSSYRIYVKHLLLAPLQALNLPWPAAIQPLLAMKPEGQLFDTEIDVKQQAIDYLLTGFKQLSWVGHGRIPSVKQLSGVLYWQPDEGRIELDSQNTVIAPDQLPPIQFNTLNVAVEWKPLSHGTRISLENLVLVNPDLTLTASGILDEPEQFPASHMHLISKVAANHAEQWLRYIPSSALKAKLDVWLKRDIKRIGKLSGQMTVDGNLADFPFDKTQGEFSIASSVNGVDLFITPKWPLSKDIDAYLRLDKRNLSAEVQHADLGGVIINNMNLRLDAIGLDHEVLLIHGVIKAAAEYLLAYVGKTPIRQRLSRLKQLDLRGMLDLDLNIEVPLYPENDDVLTQGEITLDNNQLRLSHSIKAIELDNLSGQVVFDEKGLGDSTLNATLAGDPYTIQIQSINASAPGINVIFSGNTSMDVLREALHLPSLAVMKGPLTLDGVLTLPNDGVSADHLRIESSLQDVQIALPSPLGKAPGIALPLTIDTDWRGEHTLRLLAAYGDRLSAELWYDLRSDEMTLEKGLVHLGQGPMSELPTVGLTVTGSLPVFDETVWRKALAKLPPTHSGAEGLGLIHAMALTIGELSVARQQLKDVRIKAQQLEHKEWAVQINQSDVTADVRYQPETHTLTGKVARLHLHPFSKAKAMTFKPEEIPNAQVEIEQLIYGDVDIGQVVIDSHSSKTAVQIDSCKLLTPYYELELKGAWEKHDAVNHTEIQMNGNVSQLGKSLERWDINSVVDARQGKVVFTGRWPGSFSDFDLATVEGQLTLQFNNGRITELSPETEKKLGLGKLLSILSLQTIPRRLKLDFSDLSKQGYSFDEFKGIFQLHQGVMSTKDATIDGPVAYASMKGDLDLVKRRYDLDLHISPHITASLPVVATIAGGPIAGIATWVASRIINKGMQKVTGYTYNVTGPWLDPVVQQVSIYRKPLQ